MRVLLTVLCLTVVVGCAGSLKKTPLINDQGELVTNFWGGAVYETERKAKSVAVAEAFQPTIEQQLNKPIIQEQKPLVVCNYLNNEQLGALAPDERMVYLMGVSSCQQSSNFSAAMIEVKGIVSEFSDKPNSAAEAVARETVAAIRAVTDGDVRMAQSVMNPLQKTLTVKAVVGGYESIGKAAAENGNITVGTVQGGSGSQHGGGAEGEAGAASVARDGGSSSNIIIGNNNRTATAFDSATAQNGLNQQLEPDSNGTVIKDSDQATDDNNADNNVSDDDGLNL